MELLHPSLLIGVLVVFVSLSLHFIIKSQHKSSGNLPPGRTGFPLIGETLEFLSSGRKGHPEKFVFDRMAKYSSDVFRTSLLGYPTIVFCGPAAIKFLFSNENKLVQMWFPSSVAKIFGSGTELGTKEEAVRYRELLHDFFYPEALHRYVGIIDEMTQQHIDSYWKKNDQVMVSSLAKRYTLNLACRLLLSVEDVDRVAEYEDAFVDLVTGVMSIPINFPGTQFNRAVKASNFLKNEFVAIIKRRKLDLAQGKTMSTQDFMSRLLMEGDEDGKNLSEGDIADKIFGLLFSSFEAPSATLAAIVNYLAEFPEVYGGVYKEQLEIANSKAKGELLDWKDVNKMKYSWNVACEVMRHAPIGHGTFREAITDFTYNGYSIPKGYKILWSLQSTHKSPRCFPEPLKFDPSRFDSFAMAPYTFIPFGGGPRLCPGQNYTRLVILIFMHHLVKGFKWEKVIPFEKLMANPILVMEKGLPVRLYSNVGLQN